MINDSISNRDIYRENIRYSHKFLIIVYAVLAFFQFPIGYIASRLKIILIQPHVTILSFIVSLLISFLVWMKIIKKMIINESSKYITVLLLLPIVAMVAYTYGNDIVMQLFWTVPVIVSGLYFDKRLTLVTIACALLGAIGVNFISPIYVLDSTNVSSYFGTIFLIIFLIAILVTIVISRAQYLFVSLAEADNQNIRALNQIKEMSIQLINGGKTVSSSSQELSANAEELSSQVEEINAAVSSIHGNAKHNKDMMNVANNIVRIMSEEAEKNRALAEQTVVLTKNIVEDAQNGITYSQTMRSSIDNVSSQFEKMISAINGLNDEVELIGAVVNEIANISEQINLLALNAAIEAARAGDYGRGFSVVASRIRMLSIQTDEALKQIGKTTEKIINQTNKTSLDSQDTLGIFRKAVDVIIGLVEIFNKISEQLKEGNPLLVEVSGFLGGQSNTLTEIVGEISGAYQFSSNTEESMGELSVAVEQLTGMAYYLAKAAEELAGLAQNLSEELSEEG